MEIKRYFSSLKDLNLNYHRVIHGLKTAVACLVGLSLEKYYDWPSGQWVPITVMVVMSAQTHFGGVTVILILAGQQTGIEIAIQRGFYIIVGIVIALLFSRFIFPIHARDRLRYHVSRTLLNLSKLYSESIKMQDLSEQIENIDTELSSIVIEDIAVQPRLIYEAIVGSREFASKKGVFTAILSSEHTLSRLINLMYLSLRETEAPMVVKTQLAIVESLHTIIMDSLNHLAECFENIEQPQIMFNLDEALAKIAQIVEKLPKSSSAKQLIAEHSFLFFMEQILKELENMRK